MPDRLGRVGTWGALLALVVVAASVLLRLSATVDGAGVTTSQLPFALEHAVRLAHRFAATGVALLAFAALLFAWRDRPLPRGRRGAIAAIVLFTLLLAAIGRYTPGYRWTAVTIANVAGGVALACAFWWLRAESVPRGGDTGPWAAAALAAILVHGAVGAAAAHGAIRGERALDPWHVAIGPAVAALVVVAGLRAIAMRPRAARVVIALALTQLGLGAGLAACDARCIAIGLAHALTAATLALALVSLARDAFPHSTRNSQIGHNRARFGASSRPCDAR